MDSHAMMAVIANDLDSMVHRIEACGAHVHLTSALVAVQHAKDEMQKARAGIHQAEMRRRFADE